MKIALLPVIASVGIGGALVAQNDTIRTQDGKVLRKVEIVSETLDKVSYKLRKKDETVNSRDVVEVSYGGVGEALDRARFASEQGEFGRAANLYQEVADSSKRDPLTAWASFYAARQLFLSAAGNAGQADTAATTMRNWLNSNAEHRLAPLGHETLGQALLAAGKSDDARTAFTELGKLAQSKDLGSMWVARSKFGEAQAYVASGKFADGRTAYVAASATLSAESADNRAAANLSVAAKTGEGECYLAEKQFKQGQDFFRRLSSGAGNNPMLAAAARAGEAHAIFEDAKAKNDIKAMRRAQAMLAEVSATDVSDGDASPKSVYLLGQVLIALGEKNEGKEYLQRARGMFQQVVDSYGKSRWAQKARAALASR